MKKLLKFILSRTFLFGVLIALQVGLFLFLTYQFSRLGSYAYLLLTLVSVLVVVAVLEHAGTNPCLLYTSLQRGRQLEPHCRHCLRAQKRDPGGGVQ